MSIITAIIFVISILIVIVLLGIAAYGAYCDYRYYDDSAYLIFGGVCIILISIGSCLVIYNIAQQYYL